MSQITDQGVTHSTADDGRAASRPGKPATERIRVLLIAPSLDIVGGQAVQASRLFACLSEDPSIDVAFQPINPRLPRLLRWMQSIKYVRTATTLTMYCVMLAKRVPQYEVLHVFTASYNSYMWGTMPALASAKLFKKKIVLNYRDGQAENHLRTWRTALPTVRRMDAIVAPSGYLVEVFQQFDVQAESIFNIIEMEKFRYRKRRALRPIFLHNRGLEPLYNVDCTLRAFQIIQRKYPEASLTIAHDGISRPGLERLAGELGLRNTVFLGRVPHKQMPELYDAADVYLTSPNIDCMPGSLLECFASGLPIVATDAGGIPYIATNEKTALLVPRNDHEAMARAAFRLLEEDGLAERITSNAYEECKKYCAGPVRDQWRQLYERLVRA